MAAPTLIRATFFFVDDSGYGWTESLHLQNTVLTLTQALVLAKALMPFRVKMLGTGVNLNFIRVSDDAVRGDSQIYRPSPNEQNNGHSLAGPHDIANTCLLVSLRNNDNISRAPYYIRGQDDGLVQDGIFNPLAYFVTAFNQWGFQINSTDTSPSFWGIKRKDPLVLPVPVTLLTQDPVTGDITVTTSLPTAAVQNTEVTFKGFQGLGQPAGTTFVKSVTDATHFKIASNRLLGLTNKYGTVTLNAFVVVPINNIVLMRPGHRIAGRPSNSPRGRRRRRTAV